MEAAMAKLYLGIAHFLLDPFLKFVDSLIILGLCFFFVHLDAEAYGSSNIYI